MSSGRPTTGVAKRRVRAVFGGTELSNPITLIMVVTTLGGVVVALNAVSHWFAPIILASSSVGMLVAWLRTHSGGRADIDPAKIRERDLTALAQWTKENLRGHDQVVDDVFVELERGFRLAKHGRLVGSFLLVGPEGAGKAFLGRLVGEALYPADSTLTFNLRQYTSREDVRTLFGSPHETGQLTGAVIEKRSRVIVLNEIEKAHPEILQSISEVLEGASCIDGSSGQSVDFSGCLIFGVTTVGFEALRHLRESQPNSGESLARAQEALASASGLEHAFLVRWKGIHLMDELQPLQVAEVAWLQLARHWGDYGIEVAYAEPGVLVDLATQGIPGIARRLHATMDAAIAEAKKSGLTRVSLSAGAGGEIVAVAAPSDSGQTSEGPSQPSPPQPKLASKTNNASDSLGSLLRAFGGAGKQERPAPTSSPKVSVPVNQTVFVPDSSQPASQGRGPSNSPAPAKAEIRFVSGSRAGQVVSVAAGAILGRNPEQAQIVVADSQVSGAHAWVGPQGNSVIFTDRGSTNGSFINGQPAHAGQEVELKSGDVVMLGRDGGVRFVVQLS